MVQARGKHMLAAVVAMLLWGASFVGTRVAYQSFTPLWLGLVRFAIASILFAPMLFLRRERLPKGRDLLIVAASGLLGITVYYAAENYGVELTSASNSALVVASFPAIAILVESLVRRTRPSARGVLGAVVALAGVAVLSIGASSTGSNVMLGNAILLFAGVLWGIYNLMIQGVSDEVDVVSLTGLQCMVGALGFIPLAAAEGMPAFVLTAEALAALAFLSLGCSVVAYLLYNYALAGLPASTCAALLNLIPVFGIVLSAIVLHEPITLAKLVGGAIVMLGILAGSSAGSK